MMEAIKSVDNKKLKIDFSESDQPIKVWSHENVDFEAIVLPYRTA
jgi:DNA polymerase III sliding clamp (beta) subunit (PCNA family)